MAWSKSVPKIGCEVSVRELVGVIKPLGFTSGLNRNDFLERRNAIKMHTYLLCQLIEIVENGSTAETSASASAKVCLLLSLIFAYFYTFFTKLTGSYFWNFWN